MGSGDGKRSGALEATHPYLNASPTPAPPTPAPAPPTNPSTNPSTTMVRGGSAPSRNVSPPFGSAVLRNATTAILDDENADPLIGSKLRHFQVVRLLGRGGMGAVYLGGDTSLDRPVALKVLAPEIATDGAMVTRFVREARAQARLRHPNVVQIYFIGEDRGVHF